MIVFILKRLLGGLLQLLLILLISIFLIRQIPGSYEEISKSDEYQVPELNAAHQVQIPLFYFSVLPDRKENSDYNAFLPVFKWNGVQNEFHIKLKQFVLMDFGNSLIDGVDVKRKCMQALPWSLVLQIPAIVLVILLSITIAMNRVRLSNSVFYKGIDHILIWIHSVPGFWLATLLLLCFANPNVLHWFPSSLLSVSSESPWTIWFNYPQFLILPLMCFVLPTLAYLVRMIKKGLESSLDKLSWKRALSTGLDIKQALYKEALPSALIPLIVWLAGIFPALISGALIIEQIFSIPGLGRLMYISISMRDWPVVEFLFLLGSAFCILGFIISDILLRIVDPRLNH